MIFETANFSECILCGSDKNLTREHKVKASQIRNTFKQDEMLVASLASAQRPKIAQGPQSKNLKFNHSICENCNSNKTQPADQEFDRFHEKCSAALETNTNPSEVFKFPPYNDNYNYLNVFRFFAKLLCCQIADNGGPRVRDLSSFSIGCSDNNIISLYISKNPIIERYEKITGHRIYASHGGLMVSTNLETGRIQKLISQLAIESIEYSFWIELFPAAQIELEHKFRAFCDKAREAVRVAGDRQG
ncbi:hypothetical protein [Thalassobaculum sp.]|uniref:hypothetical protein n=1 Tax=Thalassobaculum sp. TaxID=2022740 RepID=UPI003B5A77B7